MNFTGIPENTWIMKHFKLSMAGMTAGLYE